MRGRNLRQAGQRIRALGDDGYGHLMVTFGGNHFEGDFSVPLAFEGRYFIVEPGDPPLVTVVREVNGAPAFEVLKNEPAGEQTSKTPVGIVTVGDAHGGFLYKVR